MASSDKIKNVTEENVLALEDDESHLEPRFECPICLTWLRDPVLTSCGHKFCSQCINTWLQKEGACCPVDSQPLQPDSDLFPDLFTRREISQQRRHCPYQQLGCTIELSPIAMEAHVDRCEFGRNLSKKIHCPFQDVGCTDIVLTEDSLQQHLETTAISHLTLLATAIPKTRLSEHTTHSARAVESTWWDPPGKNSSSSTQVQPQPDWQELVKSLYERIVILEQQNRELVITLSNQQNQFSTLRTTTRYNHDEMVSRYCNGLYIWKLNSFKEKLKTMTTDSLKMYYSPGFYTSPNGYKICARINVSSKDPRYLSLLVHMMRSDNDDGLDWPFNGLISFVLVCPSNSEKNIRETATSKPELEAFRKPTAELNKRSFGYTEFVLIEDLAGFSCNDSLIFRIEVKPI